MTLLDHLQQGLLREEWPEPGRDGRIDQARLLLDACRGAARTTGPAWRRFTP